MSLEESLAIAEKALKLWEKVGENPTEREYYDFVSLVQLAIKRAAEPVAGLHLLLAQVHFDVDNFEAAWNEAEKTLSIDENDFEAQLIKVFVAFGLYAEILADTQVKKRGIWGAAKDVVNASRQGVRGTFAAGRAGARIGDALGSAFAPGRAKKQFLQEADRLIEIFQRLCEWGITADRFTEFSQRLIKLGDGLDKHGIVLNKSVSLYAVVANVPGESISYETADDRDNVQTIQLIAQGRMSLEGV